MVALDNRPNVQLDVDAVKLYVYDQLMADAPFMVVKGSVRTIIAAKKNGSFPVIEFLAELRGKRPNEHSKTMALLVRASNVWPIVNYEKYKKVEDDLFEFKSKQIRILCFERQPNLVVLCEAVVKKKDQLQEADVARARSARAEFDRLWDSRLQKYKEDGS